MRRVGLGALALRRLPARDFGGMVGYRTGPGPNQITVVYGTRPADDPGEAEVPLTCKPL
jgi:hypothetical protein